MPNPCIDGVHHDDLFALLVVTEAPPGILRRPEVELVRGFLLWLSGQRPEVEAAQVGPVLEVAGQVVDSPVQQDLFVGVQIPSLALRCAAETDSVRQGREQPLAVQFRRNLLEHQFSPGGEGALAVNNIQHRLGQPGALLQGKGLP